MPASVDSPDSSHPRSPALLSRASLDIGSSNLTTDDTDDEVCVQQRKAAAACYYSS